MCDIWRLSELRVFLFSTISLKCTGIDLSILGMRSMFLQKVIYVSCTFEEVAWFRRISMALRLRKLRFCIRVLYFSVLELFRGSVSTFKVGLMASTLWISDDVPNESRCIKN